MTNNSSCSTLKHLVVAEKLDSASQLINCFQVAFKILVWPSQYFSFSLTNKNDQYFYLLKLQWSTEKREFNINKMKMLKHKNALRCLLTEHKKKKKSRKHLLGEKKKTITWKTSKQNEKLKRKSKKTFLLRSNWSNISSACFNALSIFSWALLIECVLIYTTTYAKSINSKIKLAKLWCH